MNGKVKTILGEVRAFAKELWTKADASSYCCGVAFEAPTCCDCIPTASSCCGVRF